MAIASPDYGSWSTRYPTLSTNVDEPLYDEYFLEAGDWIDNTDCSLITDIVARTRLLNMMVAHIASVNGAATGGVPTGLVGRVSDASEGSVRVAATLDGADRIPPYLATSSYGVALWGALAPYRTALYVGAPVEPTDIYAFLGQGFGGGWPWGQ